MHVPHVCNVVVYENNYYNLR